MNILTDEEIKEAVCGLDMQPHYRLEQKFEEAMLDYRAVEAAVLAKFERVGIIDFEGRLWSGADKDMPSDRPLYALKEK